MSSGSKLIAGDCLRLLDGIVRQGSRYDANLLRVLGHTLHPDIDEFTCRRGHQAIERQRWANGQKYLGQFFGFFDQRDHFFRSDPIHWARFSEPQITKGLVYFLTEPGLDEATARGRFQSVLQALDIAVSGRVFDQRASAELLIRGGKRIDIYLEWKTEEGEFCNAAVEAKFGHKLTSGQLPEYRRYAINRHPEQSKNTGRTHLIVLAPKRRSSKLAGMDRNREWRFVSWQSFLIKLSKELPSAGQYKDFNRYLRSVWREAYD